ncbi:MAG: metallophosphoesterase [Prevotella sp.]|nr:metallophosphoesterase [Prevotella sp.]
MKNISIVGLCLLFMASSCTKKATQPAEGLPSVPEVTVAVVSDLHFDLPPETDQFHHVVAINHLGDSIHLDAVLQTGDIFNDAAPETQALYKERWHQGEGELTIHYPVYPLYGNHDIEPDHGRPALNKAGYELNMQYLDSLLTAKKNAGEILNVDESSRAYSFNLGGVHFVMVTLAAGDSTYCKSNFGWLRDDLATYCADGTPVVYCQHYGFDEWALDWWTDHQRRQLLETLQPYRLAAFLVGHTHQWSVQQYYGLSILQVNNAWYDTDGPASVCLLKIKGDDVTIETYAVLAEGKVLQRLEPTLHQTVAKPTFYPKR